MFVDDALDVSYFLNSIIKYKSLTEVMEVLAINLIFFPILPIW